MVGGIKPTSRIGMSKTTLKVVSLYLAGILVTFVFQCVVRAYQCYGIGGCGLTFAKAFVWALVWPASWIVSLAGLLGFTL
jgi:chromate transport protein ChrA